MVTYIIILVVSTYIYSIRLNELTFSVPAKKVCSMFCYFYHDFVSSIMTLFLFHLYVNLTKTDQLY